MQMTKIYFVNIRLFKCLGPAQRTTDAELCVLSGKEHGISRDFGSEIYILS